MKKFKFGIVLLVAATIAMVLFVSCSPNGDEADQSDDSLIMVWFEDVYIDETTKLPTSLTDAYYWAYRATKLDNGKKVGDTNGKFIPLLDYRGVDKILSVSKGKWRFELKAYRTVTDLGKNCNSDTDNYIFKSVSDVYNYQTDCAIMDKIDDANKPVSVTLSSTKMEYDNITKVSGKTLWLEATVNLDGGGTSKDVTWNFSQKDITAFKVQSNDNGVLAFQIFKSGTYTITAKAAYGGYEDYKEAKCVITINDALTHLRIHNVTENTTFTNDSASIEMMEGEQVVLSPVFTPESTSQTSILWSIDNTSVATISEQADKSAVLTAKGKGTATVTLLSQDNTSISRTLKLTVKASGAEQEWGVKSGSYNLPNRSNKRIIN